MIARTRPMVRARDAFSASVSAWAVDFQRVVRDGHVRAFRMRRELEAEGVVLVDDAFVAACADDSDALDLDDVTHPDAAWAAHPQFTRDTQVPARPRRSRVIWVLASAAVLGLCIGVALLPDDPPPAELPALPLSGSYVICPPPDRSTRDAPTDELDSRPVAARDAEPVARPAPAPRRGRRAKFSARRIRLKQTGTNNVVLSISDNPADLSRATHELDLGLVDGDAIEVFYEDVRVTVDVPQEDQCSPRDQAYCYTWTESHSHLLLCIGTQSDCDEARLYRIERAAEDEPNRSRRFSPCELDTAAPARQRDHVAHGR